MHPVPTFVYVLKGAIDIFPKGASRTTMTPDKLTWKSSTRRMTPLTRQRAAELLAVFVGVKGVKNLQPMQMQ